MSAPPSKTGNIAMGLGLWVPGETRLQIQSAEDAERDVDIAVAFRRKLKDVDWRLDIIFVRRNAPDFPVGGRWYIVRETGDGKHSAFWVVQTHDGGYCPPTDQHFEALKARDSHAHPDVWRRMRRTREQDQASAKKAREEQRREFREKLLERLDFNHHAQIPVGGADKDKLDYLPLPKVAA